MSSRTANHQGRSIQFKHLYLKTVYSNKGTTLHTKSNVQIKRTFLQKLLSDNFNAFIYIYLSLETRSSIHCLIFLGHSIKVN